MNDSDDPGAQEWFNKMLSLLVTPPPMADNQVWTAEKSQKITPNDYNCEMTSSLMQHGGFVEACEVGHVGNFVEFWRIHFLHVVLADGQRFAGVLKLDQQLVSAFLEYACADKTVHFMGHPNKAPFCPFRLDRRVIQAGRISYEDRKILVRDNRYGSPAKAEVSIPPEKEREREAQ
ncbi:hypothetical protein M514_05675 [Trichuris suis]|uniref:Uncharacterized protein n=1 Tax=Trichuris suis TaxID=68888 RepID=A0A085M865_9BILA|nr:hypothetical protein M513_05675 [Trichuris suis]KFD61977.1 hypothetical protein M514_05675 [Trichuris suis]